MIRPLRQRHRITICALAVVLPIAVVTGLDARRPIPITTSLPSELTANAITFDKVVWTKADLWLNRRIVTSLHRDAHGSAGIELVGNLAKPDVLVYWAPGNNSTMTGLPESARLLGALANGSPLTIASDMRDQTGQLILYSLADHEIVAVSRSFTIQRFNDSTF